MLLGVTCPSGSSDLGCVGDMFTGAGGVVVRSGPETVGVGGIEAMPSGKMGDGGEDEAVTCLYHRPYGWGGFVAFWWGACGVGWVWGWGVVHADLCPHVFLWHERVPFLC